MLKHARNASNAASCQLKDGLRYLYRSEEVEKSSQVAPGPLTMTSVHFFLPVRSGAIFRPAEVFTRAIPDVFARSEQHSTLRI
jgi:hypothetical protein